MGDNIVAHERGHCEDLHVTAHTLRKPHKIGVFARSIAERSGAIRRGNPELFCKRHAIPGLPRLRARNDGRRV